MAGTTYSKFFWQDWQADDELKLCSLGAQGLWMRLLCMAARAHPIGHVLIGGKKPTAADIKQVAGCSETVAEIEAFLAELVERKVCDVSRDGSMISRRLVRDARRHHISVSGGKARQKQISETETQSPIGSRHIAQPTRPATINQSPESRVQKPSGEPAAGRETLEQSLSKAEQLCNAIGESLTADTRKQSWPMQINRLIADGVDFECLLAVARRVKAEGRIPEDGVGSPRYFEAAARELMRKGGARPVEVIASAPKLTEQEWFHALRSLLMVGAWVKSEWGPSPFEDGCKAPPDMLAKARAKWEQQGNLPLSILVGNAYLAWEPRYKHLSLIPEPRPFHARAA